MKKAVIFDLDGTLLNTLDDINDSVNAAMDRYLLPRPGKEKVKNSVGNGARRLMQLVIPEGEEQPEFEEILRFYTAYYQDHCRIKTRPYEGILEAMRSLKEKGCRLAIVSNKGDGAVKELSALYFDDIVEAAVGEREGIRRKPAPDSVLEAMRLLGVSREETVYVGDSEVDVVTARNAGTDCILVSWGFRPRSLLEEFDDVLLIDTAEQLVHNLV